MKKQSLILVLTVASAMLIVSCSKKDSDDNVSVNNIIYGRVVELGTDQPLSGAELITSTCARTDNVFGCVEWAKTSDFTGPNGTFLVRRDRFRNHLNQVTGIISTGRIIVISGLLDTSLPLLPITVLPGNGTVY